MEHRIYDNVSKIFEEIIGLQGASLKEGDKAVIDFWVQNHDWQEYEFRLALENEWTNPSSRQWLTAAAGRLNIKTFLNPKNAERTLNVVDDLKRLKEIQKASSIPPGSSEIRFVTYLCRCGFMITRRFGKKFYDPAPKEGPKFQWILLNAEEIDEHAVDAFYGGLACMWPQFSARKNENLYFHRRWSEFEAKNTEKVGFYKKKIEGYTYGRRDLPY